MADALYDTDVDKLRVLPAGTVDSQPSEMLGSAEMARVVQELRVVADFVLVESAPVLDASDASLLVPACRAVLLVADGRSCTRTDIVHARQQLHLVNAQLVGSVLINAPRRGPRRQRALSTGLPRRVEFAKQEIVERAHRGLSPSNRGRRP